MPGSIYKTDGFRPEELGSVGFEKLSKESVQIKAQEMLSYAAEKPGIGGCPFKPTECVKYGGQLKLFIDLDLSK